MNKAGLACPLAISTVLSMASKEKSPVASNGSTIIPPGEHFIQLNEIRSATDADYQYFIQLAEDHGDGWVKRLEKNDLTIWQKETGVSSIKMAKVVWIAS